MVSRWYRWGPLAGVGFAVAMVVGFLIAGNSPNPDASDAKVTTYLSDSSKYHRNAASYFILLLAMLLFVCFIASLRQRLRDVGFGGHAALAYGAGLVSVTLLFVAISCFIAPVLAGHDALHAHSHVDTGTFRLTQELGYGLWVGSAVVGALLMWATSAVALLGVYLPRWFGWVGIVLGVIALASFLFFPIFGYWLWIVIASILLFRAPARLATTTTEPATVATPPPPAF